MSNDKPLHVDDVVKANPNGEMARLLNGGHTEGDKFSSERVGDAHNSHIPALLQEPTAGALMARNNRFVEAVIAKESNTDYVTRLEKEAAAIKNYGGTGEPDAVVAAAPQHDKPAWRVLSDARNNAPSSVVVGNPKQKCEAAFSDGVYFEG